MAYHKHGQNICCFSILDSALKESNQLDYENEIATRIYSSLTGEIIYREMFANEIMTDEVIKKGYQHLLYKMEHWNKNWYF